MVRPYLAGVLRRFAPRGTVVIDRRDEPYSDGYVRNHRLRQVLRSVGPVSYSLTVGIILASFEPFPSLCGQTVWYIRLEFRQQ